jgi:AbiV family abortive infection protein
MFPPEIQRVVMACFEHAKDLLVIARRELDAGGRPNIVFHLSALAIEEIGKAGLVGMNYLAEMRGEVSQSKLDEMTDHVRKLWWALWSPQIGKHAITREQVESIMGMAQHIEDQRKSAIYVSTDRSEFVPPREKISQDEAHHLLDLATALYEMEKPRGTNNLTDNQLDTRLWFLRTTDDPEKRRLIFGSKSMSKLIELGNPAKWIEWLKEIFDEQEVENRKLAQQELDRKEPKGVEAEKDKWRIRVRFYSASHTINRQQALNHWNTRVKWIKLYRVDRRKDCIDVDFLLKKGVLVDRIYHIGLSTSRQFLAALNIGTFGFFWWHLPDHVASYYEKIIDLESNAEMRIATTPALKVDWRGGALTEDLLHRTLVLLATLLHMKGEIEPITRYLGGVAVMAKIDVNFQVESHAFLNFYEAFRSALSHWKDFKDPESYREVFRKVTEELVPGWDDADKFYALGNDPRDTQEYRSKITLEQVAVMKILCDAYLLRKLNSMGEDYLRHSAERRKSETAN